MYNIGMDQSRPLYIPPRLKAKAEKYNIDLWEVFVRGLDDAVASAERLAILRKDLESLRADAGSPPSLDEVARVVREACEGR